MFRRSRRLTQADLAVKLGVASKAYISDLERGVKAWPLHLALKLEQFSAGEIRAASICKEAQALSAATVAEARA